MADTIKDPTEELVVLLESLAPTANVAEDRVEEDLVLPAIRFLISDNNATLDLSKGIGYQITEVKLDFWGYTSADTRSLLASVEAGLRANGYQMTSCMAIPDPNPENLSHITTMFNLIS